jgi:hypothetical protein
MLCGTRKLSLNLQHDELLRWRWPLSHPTLQAREIHQRLPLVGQPNGDFTSGRTPNSHDGSQQALPERVN